MAHNHHMLAFAAMMQGQSKKALGAVRGMVAGVPKEWVAVKENAAIADGFLAAPLEVMIRFGMWDDILKEPEFPKGFPIARALRHHARGVAHAAKGQPKEARKELAAFRTAAKETPKEATFGNNKAADLYAVAGPMLDGEILGSEGKLKEAVEALKKAVKKEDALRYDEPPDWFVPVRHALGAFLLKDGQAKEAEEVYRADLKKWPNNGWSLRGLALALAAQGKKEEAEAVQKRFARVWKHADVKINTSCLCVPYGPGARR
jgi:tetratricopeptide (TPR) repeat protein